MQRDRFTAKPEREKKDKYIITLHTMKRAKKFWLKHEIDYQVHARAHACTHTHPKVEGGRSKYSEGTREGKDCFHASFAIILHQPFLANP